MVKKKLVLNISDAKKYIECVTCGEKEYSDKVFSHNGGVQMAGEQKGESKSEWDVLVSGNYNVIEETEGEIVVQPEEIFCFCPSCESDESLIE